MFHIHNGDCSAEIAKKSTMPGKHFAWREALIDGPTPADVSRAEWRTLRARHLVESYGVDQDETENSLRVQEEQLAGLPAHDEVILWFEHDLFCQTNLIYLLNWFAEHNPRNTKLSLICIGEFPGLPNFRGLGELSPEQMASLFDSRHEVSKAEKTLASAAWQAYCSPDPTAIQTLLETDTSAMPFLKPALQLHLERFPFVSNGLGRIESRGLELVQQGFSKFTDLFLKFGESEPVFGVGDAQFWIALRQMSEAGEPLLRTKNGSSSSQAFTPQEIPNTAFELTEVGAAVLKGEADFVQVNGIDRWLGGVHLLGRTDLWRWDDQAQKLTYF
ncbi:MAG: RNA polymerase subunit sigma-24 [Pyrinomonadaceae bacterium]|jgi:hypothetical protein|nr:RNA polymerase subunit sigma-24 [Pyrinomonadaceae bacterium]